MGNSQFPIDDGQNNRDGREFADLVGLKSHKNNATDTNKPSVKFFRWFTSTIGLILAILAINLLGYLVPGPFDEIGFDVVTAMVYAYINAQR